jgi:hypothetical protein
MNNFDKFLNRSLSLLDKELSKLETKQKSQNLNDQDLKSLYNVIDKIIALKKQQSDMTIEEVKAMSVKELKALNQFFVNEIANRPEEEEPTETQNPGYKIKKKSPDV